MVEKLLEIFRNDSELVDVENGLVRPIMIVGNINISTSKSSTNIILKKTLKSN